MMEFSQPPPGPGAPVNYSMPPPQMSGGPPGGSPMPHQHHGGGHHHGGGGHQKHYHNYSRGGSNSHFRSFQNFGRGPGAMPMTQDDFDGKRLRKSVMRKTVDYNSAIVRALEVSFLFVWSNKICLYKKLWPRTFCTIRKMYIHSLVVLILLLLRPECGSVIIVIGEPFNQRVYTHLKCYHRPATWTIQSMQLQRGSLKRQQTKCDVPYSH